MAKPYIHAVSSAKRYGGSAEDYIGIHALMDASKSVIADSRHRFAHHNSFFVGAYIPLIFGETYANSENKVISSRDIAEEHTIEDFANRFLPSLQDYLVEIDLESWMVDGKDAPPSCANPTEEWRVEEDFTSTPYGHALLSVKKHGGAVDDYIRFHEVIDLPCSAFSDARARALTHHGYFINSILPLIFGHTITNSDDKVIPVVQLGMEHVRADFGNLFVPTLQDWIAGMNMKEWMIKGLGAPPSFAKVNAAKKTTKRVIQWNVD